MQWPDLNLYIKHYYAYALLNSFIVNTNTSTDNLKLDIEPLAVSVRPSGHLGNCVHHSPRQNLPEARLPFGHLQG